MSEHSKFKSESCLYSLIFEFPLFLDLFSASSLSIVYMDTDFRKPEEDSLLSTSLNANDSPTHSPEDADAQAAAIAVPDDTGEGGRLRMIVQLVRRSFGVKDLAAM
jgi:hypothetical protein